MTNPSQRAQIYYRPRRFINHLLTTYLFFVTLFSDVIQLAHRRETLRIDDQRLLDHVIKFARWQHPAVARGARFAVFSTTIYCF